MIFLKYTKVDTASYLSHLDLMRNFMMAIRRTKLQVNYSSGFNPHMLLYFAPPLPVGAESVAEYLVVDSSECANLFKDTLNTSLPNGIKILKSASGTKNPNFAAIARGAVYDIKLAKSVVFDFNKILNSDSFNISFEQKGQVVTKEVRDNIFYLAGEGSDYQFTLASGNKNLRADRLMSNLLAGINESPDLIISTTKTNLLTHQPAISPLKPKLLLAELVDVDKLFF